MTTRLILSAMFLGTFTWLITWAVTAWADREQQRQADERRRLDRVMQANYGPPRQAGLKRDHRRVS